MTTHVGKIARLARRRREEVCRRMEDGQTGKVILQWLNQLRDVKAVLREQFGGRPINEPNLSAWRKSGYVEWLQLERAGRSARRLAERGDKLAKVVGKRGLGDGLAIGLAVELDELTRTYLQAETDPEKRWQRVCAVHREVSRLRRDDDRVKRTLLREKRWAWERRVAAGGGRGAAQEVELEEARADEDELRQFKAGQSETDVQSLKAEVGSEFEVPGPLPRVVERRPGRAGYEYVTIKSTTGLWFKEVPGGWELPADWKSPDELANMRCEEEEDWDGVEGPGTGEGTEMQKEELSMKNLEQQGAGSGNTGAEAEARPANPVNSQAGKPALQGEAPTARAYVPSADPEEEAYIQWWLMNRNIKPFDSAELDRLYAAIPKENVEVGSQEPELGGGAHGGEGAEEMTNSK